jgi:hypothetical protein
MGKMSNCAAQRIMHMLVHQPNVTASRALHTARLAQALGNSSSAALACPPVLSWLGLFLAAFLLLSSSLGTVPWHQAEPRQQSLACKGRGVSACFPARVLLQLNKLVM